MTIRHRTDVQLPAVRHRVAGLGATVGLAGAAAVHLLWARGSTWPAADADDLADLVMGRAPVAGDARRADPAASTRAVRPDAAATFAVAGLLGASAVLVAGASGLVPVPGARAARLARLGSRVASGVLLARGSAGLAVSSLELVTTSERFRRWNLRLYSPLCLALGGAAAISTRTG